MQDADIQCAQSNKREREREREFSSRCVFSLIVLSVTVRLAFDKSSFCGEEGLVPFAPSAEIERDGKSGGALSYLASGRRQKKVHVLSNAL